MPYFLTCWLRQSNRWTVLSSSTRHAVSQAVCVLSRVEGASGAGVLVGQGSTCRAVVSFWAGPQQRDIGLSQITVVTLKRKKKYIFLN